MARTTEPHTARDVLERSARLADAFRANNRPVILVRTIARSSPRLAGLGSDALDPRLTHGKHYVAAKQAWGAMHAGADLPQLLTKLGVAQIVLTGIATSMAVESTARAAHDNGYQVVLVTDAMSDLDTAAHNHSTKRIFPQLGETVTTDEVMQVLQRRRPPVGE